MNRIPSEFYIVVVVFGTFYLMLKLFIEHRTKQKIIDKNLDVETVKAIFGSTVQAAPNAPTTFKWGLVSLAVGVALFISNLSPWYLPDEAMLGLIFTLAGFALIFYYFFADRLSKK